MKINIFVKYLDDSTGGEKICFNFLYFLIKEKIEFTVYCGRVKKIPEIPRDRIQILGLIRGSRFLKYYSFHKKAERMVYELKKDKKNVIFSFERIPGVDIFRNGGGVHKEYISKTLYYYSYHSHLRLWKSLERTLNPVNKYLISLEENLFCSSELKRVIANSSLVKDELIKYFPGLKNKIVIIHNGVDKSRFNSKIEWKEGVSNNDEKVIGFLANNYERKGLIFLLKAMQFLPEKFKLLIAGNRSLKKYKSIIDKLKNRVIFLGYVSNPLDFYKKIDIFCLPTLYDPFPNVVLEAISCKKPVVTTKFCGAKDLIIEGRNGFILNSLDPKDLADLLISSAKINKDEFIDTTQDLNEMYEKYLAQCIEVYEREQT